MRARWIPHGAERGLLNIVIPATGRFHRSDGGWCATACVVAVVRASTFCMSLVTHRVRTAVMHFLTMVRMLAELRMGLRDDDGRIEMTDTLRTTVRD